MAVANSVETANPYSTVAQELIKLGLDMTVNYQNFFHSGDEIVAGSHIRAYPAKFYLWGSRQLSTGERVHPGDMVGMFHFDRRLPFPDPQTSLATHTIRTFERFKDSLGGLARVCESDHPLLEGLNVFYFVSHWSGPLMERMGFDIFEIKNPIRQWLHNEYSKRWTAQFGYHDPSWKGFEEWKKAVENSKGVREAFISRQKLIALHGSQSAGK